MAVVQREQIKLGVLLINFSPVVQAGLQAILAKDERIKMAGHVADEQQAIQFIKEATGRLQPVHVVLTETKSATIDGVLATRLIKKEFPDIAVLVLTENLNDSYVIDAIHAGAGGYIFLKDMTPEMLIQSIYGVVDGGAQMTTALLRTAVESLIQNGRRTLAERTTDAAHLTEREVDVLRLMGNGDSNKIIAETLGISLDTTKKHVRNVIEKMQARSRTHASIIAAQAGIIGTPVAHLIALKTDLP
jgi:DNA-binding NarL/FixJ family response regulator